MNRLKLLLSLFVFMGSVALMAQTVTIKGTVTSADDGMPIPSVSVTVKGTTLGTLTDMAGSYILTVPSSVTNVTFTFVGMKTVSETLSGRTTIDVVMQTDMLGLNEVVVTALGISREKKALGYSVQDLGGDKIEKVKVTNILNAFQGKLAGVQITNADGGVSSGARILIRGVNSLGAGSNNQPLFVVDGVPISNAYSDPGAYGGMDYGNATMDINPSDVENISVLKGASAAALYGSRAVNGVVLITTKSGKSRRGKPGLGVTLEQNVMWDSPLVIPKYQNLYGQGADGEFSFVDGAYGGLNDAVDESWGPPMDKGLMIPQFDSPYDPETGIRTPTPWISHPDNVKSFFETGLRRTTSLAVAGAKESSSFRLSISNQDVKGIMPNTDLTKNTVSLNGDLAVTNKITVGGSATYISNKSDNISENGYNQGNPLQSIAQWFGRQIDMQSLKNRWREIDPITGYPFNWNHAYHDNPYWLLHNNTNSRNRDRMLGNFNMSWKLTDWMSFKAMAGTDWFIEDIMERQAQLTHGDRLGGFYTYSMRRQEVNANARLEFVKNFGDISFNGSLGGEYNHVNYNSRSTTVQDLIVPDLYSVSNAAVAATTGLYESHTELQSLFATANLGFKNWLYLDLTGRYDWSSTLPIENNSYFYPSASLSFIVTDALGIESDLLSFLKIRGSYAEVGGTAGPYALMGTYDASQPFSGQPSLGYTSTIPPLGLKPQRKLSKEVGLEIKLLQNRLSLDAAFYKENTLNQIMNIDVSRTTGFNSKTINAGNLQNSGVELSLMATPVQTSNFSWDVTVNWSRNVNKVVSLYEDMRYLNLYSASWDANVYAFPGREYGTLWGYAIVRENATPVYFDKEEKQLSHYIYSGRPIVDEDGYYIRSNLRTDLGNVYPDWFGGITNSISYKNFNMSFLIDVKKGGVIYSITDYFGMMAGTLEGTAAINDRGKNVRDAVADGGGVRVEGVYGMVNPVDGKIIFLDGAGSLPTNVVTTPVVNKTYAPGQEFFKDYWGKNELSVFDASFVKLREVSMSYSFDHIAFLSKVGVKSLNLSIMGRNLWIIHKNTKDIDPETGMGSGNIVGVETNSIPSTRSYGFNIKLDF